jgi:hypothetical protein
MVGGGEGRALSHFVAACGAKVARPRRGGFRAYASFLHCVYWHVHKC